MTTKHCEHVMGTVFSIHVRDHPGAATATAVAEGDPASDWSAAIGDVVADLHWVDETFSPYRTDSQISRLGRADVRLRDCDPAVAEVLALCAEVQEISDGYFAASIGGALDPSGLVKGWAIDRASALLSAAGSRSHAVNGGGDIQLVGGLACEGPWRVGIAHPLDRAALATVVAGRDLAVATSGSAERGCHIVNPRTGRAPTELASITVIGASITLVDAYATAAYAMGPAARDWVEELDGIEAFAVTSDGNCWATAGFSGVVAPLDNCAAAGALEDSDVTHSLGDRDGRPARR